VHHKPESLSGRKAKEGRGVSPIVSNGGGKGKGLDEWVTKRRQRPKKAGGYSYHLKGEEDARHVYRRKRQPLTGGRKGTIEGRARDSLD